MSAQNDSRAQSQAQYEKMTGTPIPRLVLTLAAPTVVSMLVSSIYNMADTFFVSQLGTSASGAVGVVFSLMAIIQAVGFTLGMGSGSIISRLLGRQQTQDATRYASTAFFTCFGSACWAPPRPFCPTPAITAATFCWPPLLWPAASP